MAKCIYRPFGLGGVVTVESYSNVRAEDRVFLNWRYMVLGGHLAVIPGVKIEKSLGARVKNLRLEFDLM